MSKYYEMVDTLLLILRQKPVITLHALHHAFIPLTMCLLFDGRVSFSLVALAVVNSFVHVVMYAYYLASALRMTPPVWWKKSITRLQIFQFTIGVIGGTYYWLVYVKELRIVRRSESGGAACDHSCPCTSRTPRAATAASRGRCSSAIS